jgi:malate dehydrogenase
LVSRSPNIILILVTNPLDAMVHVARRVSGLPKSRILGMAGVLDSARMRAFIAAELSVSGSDVAAMVLGGHGDTMVPLSRYTMVRGKPVSELRSNDRLEAVVKRTREGGAEIVGLLKTGSAFYAPSASAVDMIEAIVKDQKRVLPCAVFCEGEYGLQDVVVGVPVKLGRGGAEEVVEYELTVEERAALVTSAGAVRELCAAVDRLMV